MNRDFIRRVRYAVALGIPGLSALGSLAFLSVQNAVHAAASAPVELVVVDGSGTNLPDPLAAVATATAINTPTVAQLTDYLAGPAGRPVRLSPRTHFKQYRRPRGLSSAARRRKGRK